MSHFRRTINRARDDGASEDELDELRSEYNADPPDDEDSEDNNEPVEPQGTTKRCAMCGGYRELLGSLGQTSHFRCRDCGWIEEL